MFYTAIISKFRVFGFKGLVGYIQSFRHRWRMRQSFKRTLQKAAPISGITVIGDFHQRSSYSKVLRDFVKALHKAHIPYQTYEIHIKPAVIMDSHFDVICTPVEDFHLNRYSRIVTGLDALFFPPMKDVKQYRIVFWEFDSGLLEVMPMLLEEDKGVIVMSTFNERYLRSILPPKVAVVNIRYPISTYSFPEESRDVVRQKYGIGNRDFAVFFNFELRYARKNPEGCMRAFASAFPNDNSSKLVLKVYCPPQFQERFDELKALAKELGISGRIIWIKEYLEEKDLYALTDACDVYISLHRGEGFGLGVAEAMSLAKPVVVTNWSATTDFCSPTNSCPVDYELISFNHRKEDAVVYRGVTRWAEADINRASAFLKKCREDLAFAQRIGESGQKTILERYTIESFSESIFAFI